MNRELKDSGIEWIGDIPEHWEVVKLKFISSIDTGSKNTEDNEEMGNYPFFVRSDKVERINSYSFDGEAILTAGDGVGVAKVFHYINGKFDYHQRVYKISDFNKIIGKYLYYYMRECFYKYVIKLSAKSTVDSLRLPMFTNFQITLPPLAEQSQIAEYLDNKVSLIDKIIEKTKLSIDEYKKYKQSLITETVTKGLDKNVEMKDSRIEWIGDIPKHWEVRKLKTFSDIISKGTTPKEMSNFSDTKNYIRFIKAENIKNGYVDENPQFYIDLKTDEELKRS